MANFNTHTNHFAPSRLPAVNVQALPIDRIHGSYYLLAVNR
jgi:hypothetical protein